MIGLDTNILVRYLTRDDAGQFRQAAQILERDLTTDNPGFVSLVTVAELVWVLDSIYNFTNEQVTSAVYRMLRVPTLQIQNAREVFLAADALQTTSASFDDALIGAVGAWAGCTTTLTFDKKAARLPSFRLV
jgi:predicted nucleic-acid-binding protein